jgi:hypothetical protein
MPEPFRILVTGARAWTDRAAIERALLDAAGDRADVVVVHGAAVGADTIAGELAVALGWRVEAHPADWAKGGRRAGPRRNREMVEAGADVCLAFPGPESRGTWDCVRRARRAGIPVVVAGGSTEARGPRGPGDEACGPGPARSP